METKTFSEPFKHLLPADPFDMDRFFAIPSRPPSRVLSHPAEALRLLPLLSSDSIEIVSAIFLPLLKGKASVVRVHPLCAKRGDLESHSFDVRLATMSETVPLSIESPQLVDLTHFSPENGPVFAIKTKGQCYSDAGRLTARECVMLLHRSWADRQILEEQMA
ncbi:unnamed protein product [Protopolystoma xenopodis]|uniref:Uncharacterized protein n=1 Tax=Protopolystoma xenopodis TaxID=117903 RepID=A0A3S5ADE3_9PLAT|nr:unnamed protein product [Protopolystoma xenopodis]